MKQRQKDKKILETELNEQFNRYHYKKHGDDTTHIKDEVVVCYLASLSYNNLKEVAEDALVYIYKHDDINDDLPRLKEMAATIKITVGELMMHLTCIRSFLYFSDFSSEEIKEIKEK